MHVLILPSWYFPAGTEEIPGRMFQQLAAGLREEGVDARILYASFTPKDPLFKKRTMQVEARVPTWRITGFFPPKQNAFLIRWWIRRYVQELKHYIRQEGMPDLIHAQSYMAASVGAALYQELKVPFIFTERLSAFILGQVPPFHYPLLKRCLEQAVAITCVSPGLLERIQPHTNRKMLVIPNFFDETVFYPSIHQATRNPFIWVSVGEPAHIKGLDILLRAFAELKRKMSGQSIRLILADRIPEEKALVQLASSLKIDDDLEWTGLISQPQLAEVFRKSHALVSASRVETFGKAIIEAQACGLPVAATITDGARYILQSSHQGEMAAPDSVESFANAMGLVMAGYDTYSAEDIAALTERRFGKKVVLRQWMDLYKSIVR